MSTCEGIGGLPFFVDFGVPVMNMMVNQSGQGTFWLKMADHIFSRPLYAKNAYFKGCLNYKMDINSGRSSKNWFQNWYGLLCFDTWLQR